MDQLELSSLLWKSEYLYYNYQSNKVKDLALSFIKSYISFYYKNDIDSFINDLIIGDRGIITDDFIILLKEKNNYKYIDIKTLANNINLRFDGLTKRNRHVQFFEHINC